MPQNNTLALTLEEGDTDYELSKDYSSCWITVDDVSVWVRRTEEGVEVQLFPHKMEAHPPVDVAFLSHDEAADKRKRWIVDTSHIGA